MTTKAPLADKQAQTNGVRTTGFSVLLVVFVVNATVTIAHFGMMFAGVITTRNPLDLVQRIAIPDIAIAALPSFVAAWGLWKCRRWGLWIALIVAGAYFHGQVELLVMAVQQRLGLSMGLVSLYFIGFSVFFSLYLWRRRDLFV